jgi:predicted O-methyltransferase YrrM
MPIRARHAELSVIASLDDSPGSTNGQLVETMLKVGTNALSLDLSELHERSAAASRFVSVYPGEHYRLLASLVEALEPQLVVEIGTFTGLSALAMLVKLRSDARLVSYDIVPWDAFPQTALRANDFRNGRLEQRLGNLADPGYFDANSETLQAASIIFVDGPKDGRFEPRFMQLLSSVPRTRPCLLVFDDIRLWRMLAFWRNLQLSKFDATSIGHYSGTGICMMPTSSGDGRSSDLQT